MAGGRGRAGRSLNLKQASTQSRVESNDRDRRQGPKAGVRPRPVLVVGAGLGCQAEKRRTQGKPWGGWSHLPGALEEG